MTDLQQVVAFVGVTSLDDAERFYGGVLNLDLNDERPFALTASLGGSQLRITEVGELVPAPYTVVGFTVADIVTTVERLSAAGVEFTRYDGMGQDDHAVWISPSGARVAWFPDPDGNNLSLTQQP